MNAHAQKFRDLISRFLACSLILKVDLALSATRKSKDSAVNRLIISFQTKMRAARASAPSPNGTAILVAPISPATLQLLASVPPLADYMVN